jgi:hypothetical protein
MRVIDREIRMSDGMLQCPRCTDHYLHQSDVMVFNRKEDAEKVHLTSVIKDEPMVTVADVDNNTSLNPSGRRQGLLIDFRCESCDGENKSKVTLAIYQHKGSTYFDWRQD